MAARRSESTKTAPPPPPDQSERDAVIHERARNVAIDAGAGTGKTTILVDRIVHMVAPQDGSPPLSLQRIAAITFTRKAAGELRLRIREGLLAELARPDIAPDRAELLRQALGDLDAAHVGTIHSFADRLLRRFPVESALSPAYDIAENVDDIVSETVTILLEASQIERLAAEMAGTDAAPMAAEAQTTIIAALHAGIRADSRERGWAVDNGLDALVKALLDQRDIPFELPDAPRFDLRAFRRQAKAVAKRLNTVSRTTPAGRWLGRAADALEQAQRQSDPAELYRLLHRQLTRGLYKMRLSAEFSGDKHAWAVWKAFDEGKDEPEPLRDTVLTPLYRWLARRLVRLRPVVVALYEKVKLRHQVVDQVDLLLKLRNLLRDHPRVRGELQDLFDHILVDEFQDTDPLQAEIVLFLSEKGTRAKRWNAVKLTPGKLTIVGDPKQSIYRFRRADIRTYDEVRRIVESGPCCTGRLSANFRSRPELIDWFNDRLSSVLGPPNDNQPFDPDQGTVAYQDLVPGKPAAKPKRGKKPAPVVHVLHYEVAEDSRGRADEYRAVEAEALSRYLRWLVAHSGMEIRDPVTGQQRQVQYGDIAILAVVTTHLPLLFTHLDTMGVPYSSRGGTLFLADDLNRQFILGLRAIADRDDGVAQAALMRPPFFAIDPLDLIRHKTARRAARDADEPFHPETSDDERIRRAAEALALVHDLRRRRFDRSPGATARDLLERTAFGRTAALGPNGPQRIERLRELCLYLEHTATNQAITYDAVTTPMRDWVDSPPQLDPPRPVGAEAVQISTVHQAKGLEFPVTVLWDGKGKLAASAGGGAFHLSRDGQGWALGLDGCQWEQPPGLDLAATETRYKSAERRRVVYVAATRARDLLVVPLAGTVDPKYFAGTLLQGPERSDVEQLACYREGKGAPWSKKIKPVPPEPKIKPDKLSEKIAKRWADSVEEAAVPRFVPTAVSTEAHERVIQQLDEDDEQLIKRRPGRHGTVFGETVHTAIALVAEGRAPSPQAAVERTAAIHGLDPPLIKEAVADVKRALTTLESEGLLDSENTPLRLEYPVAGQLTDGKLLIGYIDAVAVKDGTLHVIDFKTDQPPDGDVAKTHPQYAEQVRTYAKLLQIDPELAKLKPRLALLFTGNGTLRSL